MEENIQYEDLNPKEKEFVNLGYEGKKKKRVAILFLILGILLVIGGALKFYSLNYQPNVITTYEEYLQEADQSSFVYLPAFAEDLVDLEIQVTYESEDGETLSETGDNIMATIFDDMLVILEVNDETLEFLTSGEMEEYLLTGTIRNMADEDYEFIINGFIDQELIEKDDYVMDPYYISYGEPSDEWSIMFMGAAFFLLIAVLLMFQIKKINKRQYEIEATLEKQQNIL